MRLLPAAVVFVCLALGSPAAAQDWTIYPDAGTGDFAFLESENVSLGITIGCDVQQQRFSFGLWLDTSRELGPLRDSRVRLYILRFDDREPFPLGLGFIGGAEIGEKGVFTYDDEDTKPLLLHLLTSDRLSVHWEPVEDFTAIPWDRSAHFNLTTPSTKRAVGGVLSSCGMLPVPSAEHQATKLLWDAEQQRQQER